MQPIYDIFKNIIFFLPLTVKKGPLRKGYKEFVNDWNSGSYSSFMYNYYTLIFNVIDCNMT